MESQEQTDPPEFIHLAVGVSVHRWGQALAGFQVLSSTNRIGQLRILAFRNLEMKMMVSGIGINPPPPHTHTLQPLFAIANSDRSTGACLPSMLCC